MLLVFAMKCCSKIIKCLALCSASLPDYCCLLPSPVCLPHLLICTRLISSPIDCLPTIICVMLVSIVFLFFLSYATFLSDSILACLCTYFLFRFYFCVIPCDCYNLYCHIPYGFSTQFMCLIWSLFLKFLTVLAWWWWNMFVYLWFCSLVSTTHYFYAYWQTYFCYFPFVTVCTSN